jgi:hypothetical protein
VELRGLATRGLIAPTWPDQRDFSAADPPMWVWRLQYPEKFSTFNRMMNSQASLGFRHLRRIWNGHPGWVAV